MGIRKSKNSPIDIDKMFGNVEVCEQVEKETEETNEYLRELREAKATLQKFTNDLEKAIEAECRAEGILKNTASCCKEVVAGIKEAISEAQEKTVLVAEVNPDTVAKLQRVLADDFNTKKRLMDEYCAKHTQVLAEHEARMRKILSQNRGIWLSNFWAGVTYSILIVYAIITLLYARFG